MCVLFAVDVDRVVRAVVVLSVFCRKFAGSLTAIDLGFRLK